MSGLASLLSKVHVNKEYRHVKTGNRYIVVGVAYEEATLTPLVVYREWENPYPMYWTRPATEFLDERFEYVGE